MNYTDRIASENLRGRVTTVRLDLGDHPCCGGQCVETIESVPWSRRYSSRCRRHDPARTEKVAFRLARLEKRRSAAVRAASCKIGKCVRGTWPAYKHGWCWRHHPSRVEKIALRLAVRKRRSITLPPEHKTIPF